MRLPLVDIDPADFALVLLVTPEGEDDPIEIAKIDCRHETVHLHEGATFDLQGASIPTGRITRGYANQPARSS